MRPMKICSPGVSPPFSRKLPDEIVCTTPVTVSGALATGNCGIGSFAPIDSVTLAPTPA